MKNDLINSARESMVLYAAYLSSDKLVENAPDFSIIEISDKIDRFLNASSYEYSGPVILYDRNKINERLDCFAQISKRRSAHFLHSVKSTHQDELLKISSQYLSGFDISNISEYQRLPEDLSNKIVFFTSPVVTEELSLLKRKNNSLCLIVDGIEQAKLIESLNNQDKFGIRLNTSDLLDKNGYSGDDFYKESRFGYKLEDFDFISSLILTHKEKFAGFHLHHGCESNSVELCLALAKESVKLFDELGIQEGFLDFGGGYHNLSFEQLDNLICQLRQLLPNKVRIIFEPGRSISEDCLFAIARVNQTRNRGRYLECILDLSKECHLKWSQPKFIDKYESTKRGQEIVRFYGPTCYEGDYFGEYHLMRNEKIGPRFIVGDLVLFAGLTTYSEAWSGSFNGIKPCQIKMI